MTLSITESDGTKRTMQGAIEQIHIDVEEHSISKSNRHTEQLLFHNPRRCHNNRRKDNIV